jgi:hypothetical protein
MIDVADAEGSANSRPDPDNRVGNRSVRKRLEASLRPGCGPSRPERSAAATSRSFSAAFPRRRALGLLRRLTFRPDPLGKHVWIPVDLLNLSVPVIVTVPSPTVCVRCSRTGFDGYGRATCDAGSSSRGPLFCDCAPGANGMFNLRSSCWWRNGPTGEEAVKEPTCDFGGGRLVASLTDPDGTVVLGHSGGGARSITHRAVQRQRHTEHRLIHDSGARRHQPAGGLPSGLIRQRAHVRGSATATGWR